MEKDNCIYDFEIFKKIAQEFAPCMHDYLYVYDISNDTYYITEQALERFALPSNVFHNVVETHDLFVYPEDREMLSKDLQKITDGEKDEHDLEYRWLGKNGQPLWINCKGRLIRTEEGTPNIMVGCINEIGKKQSANNISGLLTEDAFKQKLYEYEQKSRKGYVLRIGIDGLKTINERHGTAYGDYVLKTVAECIRSCLSDSQYVYHIVSDEYVILDMDGSGLGDMKKLYQKIREKVDRAVEERRYEAFYTISGGIVDLKDNKDNDYEQLLMMSEFALSEAKEKGRNQVYKFKVNDYEEFLRRRAILGELRKSVSNDYRGFELNFQPIIKLEEEKLYSAEALLRFTTESGERISPVEFIPLLESSGLIIPVGKWIIRNALEMCSLIRETVPEFKVSINLSYIQVSKSSVYDEIMEGIEDIMLPTSCLIVEMTESGQLENSAAVQNVWRKLKANGVSIAIDDFGTGYSNLHSIGNLNPNIIKIDRSFTVKALKNDYEYQLLIHIIDLVHSLGLSLVIEGIETKEELDIISDLNPDFIQGYYYGKPCTKAEFVEKFA